MDLDDSGRTRAAAVVALLLALVAVVAVGGLALGAIGQDSDDRTGEELLSDVQETYDDADSVSSDGVVTVEAYNRTTQFEVSAAAAGDEQVRVNVSKNGLSVLTGVDNGTVWRYDSVTRLTGVVDSSGDTVTVSLRGGTETPARPDLSALPGDIDLDTELSAALDSFDGELPEEFEEQLDGLPANTTVGDVLANESLAGGLDRASLTGGSGVPETFEAFDFSGNLSEFDIPETFEAFDFESLNRSDLRERIDGALTGEFNRSAVTVERVGTTTIDGTEANKLLLTHPEVDAETRLWTDAESDTVLRQETTAPGLTVTVDVRETRFDVSPAESTFEPPGATELASLSVSTADSLDAFAGAVPSGAAVPGEGWQFEAGAVLSGESSVLTAVSGIELSDVATGVYTDGDSSVVVGQTDRAVDIESVPFLGTQTVTIGDREVLLLAGERLSVGVYSEAGTTVVVAGELSGPRLESVITDIDRQDTGE